MKQKGIKMIIKTEQLKPHTKNSFYFDDITGVKWNEFLESIRINGVIEPLIITEEYMIVSGHQRLRACLELEIPEVPCEIRHYESDDQIEKELIEINVRQRGDIGGSPVKIGRRIRALERLYGIRNGGNRGNQYYAVPSNNLISQTKLAQDLNMSNETLRNYKKLTKLIPEIEKLIYEGVISTTTAVTIVKQLSPMEQKKLSVTIDVTQKYTQNQIQYYINQIKYDSKEDKSQDIKFIKKSDNFTELFSFIKQIENFLKNSLIPVGYKSWIAIENGDTDASKNLGKIIDMVESWCCEIKEILNSTLEVNSTEKADNDFLGSLTKFESYLSLLQGMNATVMKTQELAQNNFHQIQQLDEQVNIAIQMSTARTLVTESFNKYMTQTEFGNQYFLKISSVQIGWLLQMCGLKMRSNLDSPYDDSQTTKYWKSKVYLDKYGNEHIQYLWNYKSCSSEIDTWLKKHHLFTTFYSCSTHTSLKEYITAIHNNWLNGEYR